MQFLLLSLTMMLCGCQNKVSLPRTKVHNLTAKSNNITYRINISLPRKYNSSNKSYPVIYMLDSDYSFPISYSLAEHLGNRGIMEYAILVGIGYPDQENIPDFENTYEDSNYHKNRIRDYTPVLSEDENTNIKKYYKDSGGAERFKAFIKHELMPFINDKYRTNKENTIIGHSYGGLFAFWVFLSDNKMFNKYIAISPSFWYDDNWIFSLLQDKKQTDFFGSKIYFNVGENETERMKEGVLKMKYELDKLNKDEKIGIFQEISPQENHSTAFPIGLTHGFIFAHKLKSVNPIK